MEINSSSGLLVLFQPLHLKAGLNIRPLPVHHSREPGVHECTSSITSQNLNTFDITIHHYNMRKFAKDCSSSQHKTTLHVLQAETLAKVLKTKTSFIYQ